MKYITILGDGMADWDVEALGGKTPLDVAKKPNIDKLAAKSICGMAKTVPDGMKPGSDTANLSVMGYDPTKYYTGRSPLEAVSVGVKLEDTDITFRTNFVTLSNEENYEDKTMVDYSAGEISTKEADELIKTLNKELKDDVYSFYTGFSYRHILVQKNGKLTMTLIPPHDISGRKVTEYLPSGENSEKLLEFMKKSHEILKDHPVNVERKKKGLNPANSIWIWGEGSKAVLPSFESLYGVKGGVVSAVDLIKGIAISADLESVDVEGATGNVDTNFDGKAEAAIKLLETNDFIYVHLEAPDECGHRGELENKVLSIELIDEKIVGPILSYMEKTGEDFRMMIMPDHPTPLKVKTHVMDPVPFIIYDSRKEEQGVDKYCEKECEKTGIYEDKACLLMKKLISE